MKITKSQLKRIVKEELSRALRESDNPYDGPTTNPGGISDEQYDKNAQAIAQRAAEQTRHTGDEEPSIERQTKDRLNKTLIGMHIPEDQRGQVINMIMGIVDIGLDKQEAASTHIAIRDYLKGLDAQ